MIKFLSIYLLLANLVILILAHLIYLHFLRKERKRAKLAKNIFEELISETEKILGESFKILTKTAGCNFCFKNFEKSQIIRALQNTVVFVKENAGLKSFTFVFKDKDIKDIKSLASIFLKLVSAGIKSMPGSHFIDQQDFLECFSCQMTLFRTAEYFTAQLILEKRGGEPLPIKEILPGILQKILESNGKIGIAILAAPCSSLPFVDSREKLEILRKYSPLFKEKEINSKKIFDALAKATQEKKQDLGLEEFEKTLKDLLEVK
jgi:hypothetical protein